MKHLITYINGYKKEAILAPSFKMLEAMMDLITPLIVAQIIDVGIAGHNEAFILKNVFYMIALSAIGLAFSITAQYFAAKASVGFSAKLRQAVFDHIMGLSYSTLDQVGSDTLVTRLTSDVNQIQTGLNMGLRLLLRSPFIVFGALIMAFFIDVKCAIVFAIAVPLLGAVTYGIMRISIPLFHIVQTKLDQVTALTRENLTGLRVIRAFRREWAETDRFYSSISSLKHSHLFVGRISALLNPLTFCLINLATIFLIQRGAIQVNLGLLAQGNVVALYNYMAQMIVELIKLSSLIITLNRAIACGDRVASVFDLKNEINYKEDANEISDELPVNSISFQKVSFTYPDSPEEAISDITFSASAGQTIGIIGGTGCGKSTLINLIPRFYDVNSGSIKIDNIDIKDISKNSLSRLISIVPQKAALFSGSIRDNLKLGNKDASDEELYAALRTAQAEDFVSSKEGGLDYILEQNARNLSGGQKQRLTIARALATNPRILILDDSSSALDYATDHVLRQALRQENKGRITIIVSQRAAGIMDCDLILAMDDGHIAEMGKHQELMDKHGIYYEIYRSQFPDASEEKGGKS
jgi:ATP-binding cassette, subfamily B, multidrug efflux pump